MNPLRISTSCNLHFGSKENVNEYFKKGLPFYKKVGFEALDCPLEVLIGDPKDWETKVETLIQDAADTGIRFELCHLPFGVTHRSSEEEMEVFRAKMQRAIEAARMLGVEYAVLHPLSVTVPEAEFVYEEWLERCVAFMDPFVEQAAGSGVRLAVENMRIVPAHYPVHRYCQNAEELCALADQMGIGVCWDFGHANISGLNQAESLAMVGSRLKVLHVNDNHAEDDVHIPPFMGTVKWADAMKGLSAIGFNGLFNYEIAATRIPEALREDFARYLIHAAEELMKLM